MRTKIFPKSKEAYPKEFFMLYRFITNAIIVSLLATAAWSQNTESDSSDLLELAAAERSFAAETVKLGFRDGFAKYFADDGIGFGPHPERTREKLLSGPAPTGPRAVVFNWSPMIGDISRAGDLGYTTGPVLFTDVSENPKPPWHGMYFSVWQKQADGTWKVAVDMGIDTPQAVAPIDSPFTPVANGAVSKGTSGPSFLAMDYALSLEIGKNGMSRGYGRYLSPEFRVHRTGHMPIVGVADLDAFFQKDGKKLVYKVIAGKLASSNDLAFTYGSFSETGKPAEEIQGYYVHVWRRDKKARWQLVADVANLLPEKK